MLASVLQRFRRLLRRLGVDVIRYTPENHPLARRSKLFEHYAIEAVFDIGANIGQYGLQLRQRGFQGKIVSFEPLSQAFSQLRQVARLHPPWEVVNLALSDSQGEAEIHISANSMSSSFLPILPQHLKVMPESRYVGTERVRVSTLQQVVSQYAGPGQRLYAKIDAQGCDRRVIEGAGSSLKRFCLIQMEVSLIPLYENENTLSEMLVFMSDKGYQLVSLEPGFSDPRTGHLLQVDCIFLDTALAGPGP